MFSSGKVTSVIKREFLPASASYRVDHSTETALLRLLDDVYQNIDNKLPTVIGLLLLLLRCQDYSATITQLQGHFAKTYLLHLIWLTTIYCLTTCGMISRLISFGWDLMWLLDSSLWKSVDIHLKPPLANAGYRRVPYSVTFCFLFTHLQLPKSCRGLACSSTSLLTICTFT